MATKYRIIDLRNGADAAIETIVENAFSPENAALKATGEVLVRSGSKLDLRVRVYFEHPGQPTSMVRLYRRAEDRP